ncbi:MAG: FimV/HubP family polar landmark protein [Burkholderiales bacterium]
MKKRSVRHALNEIAAVAALSTALMTAPNAWGLGLGRLAVQSALGESLRAEIEVTSLTPEEAANLRVRVAPPESYRVAGIDYNAVLPATAVTLQRHPDGRAFLRIVSDRAVQEPFVDLILELTWSSGRLLREYTLLFDPPGSRTPAAATTAPVAAAPAPATPAEPPVAAPPAAVAMPAPAAVAPPAPAPAAVAAPAPVQPQSPARTAQPTAPARGAEAAAKTDGGEYKVRSGDTLSKIAAQYQSSGVSLDQLLVGLYRSNSQAFIGNNMNLLRSGVVLTVPTADQAGAIDKAEARKIIQAQSADFNAYRQRLATAVPAASEKEASRQATGKVQTEVQDRKEAAAPTPDRLTLDKGKGASATASAAEDKLAKERAQKEAAARVQELSRNLEDLKKLQAASAAQAASAGKPSAPAAPAVAAAKPVVPVPAPTPSPAPAPAPAASVAAAPVPASAPAVAAAPAASEPMVAASAASETAVAAASAPPVAAAASTPPPVTAPPVEEPSLLDSLSDNPLVLPGAGLILAILAGFGWYRLRNRNKDEAGVTSFLESRLQPDSFFGASGGQRVDTRDAAGTPSSMSYSLSQIDAIGDVDPVAEADVYLAYGRDLQAEEILKEAMRANPDRLAIRTKLLEVYAKRRDTKGFELLAGELYGLTGGAGDDWAKAQELGRSIDPDNPLYEPGGAPTTGAAVGDALEPLGASTMPQSVVPSPSRFEESGEGDLDFGATPSGSNVDLDLDISVPGPMDEPARAAPSFSLSEPSMFSASQPASGPVSLDTDSRSLEFDLQDLPPVVPPPPAGSPSVDLGGLSLDLDGPASGPSTGVADLASAPLDLPLEDDGADPLVRKLELAEEFRQIGDLEGARDLLLEVIDKAEGSLRARAQGLLDNLS